MAWPETRSLISEPGGGLANAGRTDEASAARMAFSRSSTLREICLLRFSLRCGQSTCCGLFDEMSDGLRMGHVHGVAAFDLDNG